MSMMAGHVEGRLAFLKTELKITERAAAALERGRRRNPRQYQNHRRHGRGNDRWHADGHAAGEAGGAEKIDHRASRGAAEIQGFGAIFNTGVQTSELAKLLPWPHRKLCVGLVYRRSVRATLQFLWPRTALSGCHESRAARTVLVADPDRDCNLRLPYCGEVLFTDGAHRSCLRRTALIPDPCLSANAPFHALRPSWRPRAETVEPG